MKHVIIRDDDISFFTPVEVLDTLYGSWLSSGGTVALSVVPAIQCGIKAGIDNGPFWTEYRMDYSPFIPPDYREVNGVFSVGDNKELVSYLMENKGYEIVQHGYAHTKIRGVFEGKLSDPAEIMGKIEESKNVMFDAFGYRPEFFVGPWDAFSPGTISCLKDSFKGISMYRLGKRHMPWYLKPSAVLRQLVPGGRKKGYFRWGDFVIFEHPGTIISMFNKPGNILPHIKEALKQVDILVLVTHHWEFFYDWNGLNSKFFEAWQDVLDFLLNDDSLSITTFHDIYEKITGHGA